MQIDYNPVMKIDEAISTLMKMKSNKTAIEQHLQEKTHGKSMMGLKNVLVSTMCDLTKLIVGNRYEVSVKNFPKQDPIVDQLKEMNITLNNILLTLKSSSVEPLVKSPKLNKSTKVPKK